MPVETSRNHLNNWIAYLAVGFAFVVVALRSKYHWETANIVHATLCCIALITASMVATRRPLSRLHYFLVALVVLGVLFQYQWDDCGGYIKVLGQYMNIKRTPFFGFSNVDIFAGFQLLTMLAAVTLPVLLLRDWWRYAKQANPA